MNQFGAFRKLLLVVAALALLATVGNTAVAGTQDDAIIALHVQTKTPMKAMACWDPHYKPTIPCSQYRTAWPSGAASIYLVVARAEVSAGIAGVSCGITYDDREGVGADVFGWFCCGDFEFPTGGENGEWPASGAGDRIVWSTAYNCQRSVIVPEGVHAIAGAFYVYAYGADVFRLTPNNNVAAGPEFAVVDCSADTTRLPLVDATAEVGFAGLSGYNPCAAPVAVNPATWGSLKQQFVK